MPNTLFSVFQLVEGLTESQLSQLKSHLETIEEQHELDKLTVADSHRSQTCEYNCPHCQSKEVTGWGTYKGRKRFKCKNCNRTFNELTGTPWHRIRDHKKFKAYIQCMIEGLALRACEERVGICLETAFQWRHKLLKAFEQVDLNWLKGEIQADETFFLESFKGQDQSIKKLERTARNRGGKASKRGISDEQVCVMAAQDSQGNSLLRVAGKGRLSKKMVRRTLSNKIRKQRTNRAILVTDKHPSYKRFVKDKNLQHQKVYAKDKQYVNEDGFSINKVNAFHSRLKSWIQRFKGVATSYLQNYLTYFRLWDKVNSFKERFKYFFNISARIA